jgi:hypothetical protein
MTEFVKEFWLGTFESCGHSQLFILLPPDSRSFERQPGNYATRASGIVVKVAEDGRSYPTHERKHFFIRREDVAYVLCRPEWRGITAEHPAGFAQWTDERRDTERPNWRKEYEESYAALSTIPFNQWSPDMRVDHYSQWRIERGHFGIWYRASSLSAGAPLESFWPGPSEQFAHAEVMSATLPKPKVERRKGRSGRKRKFTPAQLATLRSEMFRLLDEYGDPASDNPHSEFKSKADIIRALQAFAINEKSRDFPEEPSRTTIQSFVDQWLEEWRTRGAGN